MCENKKKHVEYKQFRYDTKKSNQIYTIQIGFGCLREKSYENT